VSVGKTENYNALSRGRYGIQNRYM
jgi:hypothetical protein